jgi:transcriptional regulator with XRE-family HTH domain
MRQGEKKSYVGTNRPADSAIAIVVLRSLRGWDQAGLAQATGLSVSSISRYENGKSVPPRRTFERIVAAVGVPIPMADRLLAWIRSARAALAGSPADMEGLFDVLCGEASEGITHAFRSAAALILAGRGGAASAPWGRQLPPSPEDRRRAVALWEILLRRDPPDRQMLVEDAEEFRNWGVCELVCYRSSKSVGIWTSRSRRLRR